MGITEIILIAIVLIPGIVIIADNGTIERNK